MISFMKRLWRDRRGNALVLAGAALPLLVGSAGLATDTIQWALWKRQLQRTADSAAMAGVYAKVAGKTVDNCSDVPGATYDKPVAWDVKKTSISGMTPTCSAENPPSTGSYSTDENAVKVTLSVQKMLSFSSMFMTAAPVITATATAQIVPSGKYCVVSLENTATTGINASGSSGVTLGCGMITNSTSLSAAVATGSGSVHATPVAAVGGIPASNNWASNTVLQPFTVAQDDPFANTNPPAFNASDCAGNTTVAKAATVSFSNQCFRDLQINGTVTLSGNIIIDGGSFRVGTDANVTCNACTIFLTNSSSGSTASIGNFEVVGQPTMNMTAPASGTYAGLLVYQDRRAQDANSANFQDKVRGSSTSYFEGAFYFPKQELEFEGNTGMNTKCLQLVARRVKFTGNASIQNQCPTNSGAKSFDGKRVRLVA
jgi:Flp pilus assembly protein TadG